VGNVDVRQAENQPLKYIRKRWLKAIEEEKRPSGIRYAIKSHIIRVDSSLIISTILKLSIPYETPQISPVENRFPIPGSADLFGTRRRRHPDAGAHALD
jgi:hypothetical protein